MANKECLYITREEGVEKQTNGDFEYTITKKRRKKITELIVGRKYKLQYTGQYCHFATISEKSIFTHKDLETNLFENTEFIFVGKILDGIGGRNIFYTGRTQSLHTTYVMFSCIDLDYVLEEIQ